MADNHEKRENHDNNTRNDQLDKKDGTKKKTSCIDMATMTRSSLAQEGGQTNNTKNNTVTLHRPTVEGRTA